MPGVEDFDKAYTAIVSDALDLLGLRNQAIDPAIRAVSWSMRLVGRALPVRVAADDSFPDPPYEDWIQLIEMITPGDVVVFDVDENARGATWGELFSCAALGRGAQGALSDGYVRDVAQIVELGFPVFARGSSPLDTLGRAKVASVGEPVSCGGVTVSRHDYIVADADGAVVVPNAAVDDVLATVNNKMAKEMSGRDDLLSGVSVRDVWDRYGVF